jgi:hypothetical protein
MGRKPTCNRIVKERLGKKPTNQTVVTHSRDGKWKSRYLRKKPKKHTSPTHGLRTGRLLVVFGGGVDHNRQEVTGQETHTRLP